MAIEVQRYPNKGESPFAEQSEDSEDLIVEIARDSEEDGGVEFQMSPEGEMMPVENNEQISTEEHNMNLAEVLDPQALGELSSEITTAYEQDQTSREDWLTTFSEGLELLGIKTEERDEPFPGASGVTHPLLAEAATQFQAQAYKELLPPSGPVKTKVVGAENSEVMAQSQRVKEYMNYQITEVMEEYDPDMDSLLFYLPLAGSAFKKVYFDSLLNLQLLVL